jgi:O-antigen/teichoic acid export membrane protein
VQKKFVTNLIILLCLNLLIKPFWILGIEPYVQIEVGNSDYGTYFVLFNFSFLLNILLDFGITNFNNKNIAQNNHLLDKHFSGLFILKLALGVVYIVATVVCALVFKFEFRFIKLLMLLGFNQFLISMVLYLRSNLQALHLFKTDALISVLDRVIMISIVAAMLWTNILNRRMDVMDFAYAQLAGYFITAVIAFFAVIAKTEVMKLRWSWPFSLMILKKSFPFAVLVLLMTFYNRIDPVMLERMMPAGDSTKTAELTQLRDPHLQLTADQETRKNELEAELTHTGAEQAGLYAKAYRLLDATNMIAYLFSVLLIPMFSRMLKYRESVEQLVKLSFTLLITVAIIVAVGCAFYSREIMTLQYGEHLIGDEPMLFALLMNCFIAVSTTYVFGSLLTANGNLRELNIMAFCGMILNVGMNIVFIKVFDLEARGTAISSLSTQLLTAIAQVLIVQRIFKFRTNWRLLINLVVFVAGVIAIALVCHTYLLGTGKTGWVLGFVLMAGTSFVWALATRLISIKGMFRILKYG